MSKIITVLVILGAVFGGYCLSSWIFQLLWNWVAVDLFNAPVITFWKSMGLVLLLSFVGGLVKGSKANK